MHSRRLRAVPEVEQAAFGALLGRLRTSTLVTVERTRQLKRGGVARWTTQTTMSQNELARRTGLDPGLICRLEAGTRAPGRATVEKLAAALELDADDATLLLIAARYWPWHALDDGTALLVAQTALAVIAGDYRRLEDVATGPT